MRRGLVATAVLAIAACSGGGGDASPAPSGDETTASSATDRPTSTVPHDDTAVAYLEGLAEATTEGAEAMVELSEPGSPAAIYGTYWREIVRDSPPPPSEVSPRMRGFDVCDLDACLRFDAFEWNDAGLVVTFDIAGEPMRERIAAGRSPVTIEGVTVNVDVAYVTNADVLFLVVSVQNRDGTRPFFTFEDRSTYDDGDRRRRTRNSSRIATVDPDITAIRLLWFETTKRPGSLRYEGSFDEDGADSLAFDLPVP